VYAVVAGLAYGLLLNLSFWPFTLTEGTSISFVAGDPLVDNLRRFLLFTAVTSLGFDIPRAVVTATLVLLTGRPVLRALRRASRRAAFDAPVHFGDPDEGGGDERGGDVPVTPARGPR
jgi:energy-coupling factor transport system substrate-specific component